MLSFSGRVYHSTPKPPDYDLSDDELEGILHISSHYFLHFEFLFLSDTLELSEPDGAGSLVGAAAQPVEANATADAVSSLDPQVQPVLEGNVLSSSSSSN